MEFLTPYQSQDDQLKALKKFLSLLPEKSKENN